MNYSNWNRIKLSAILSVFRLKPVLQREIGNNAAISVLKKMKYHYMEIDKREPGKKGIMSYHRILLITGLSLYRAMQEEPGVDRDVIGKVHRVLWNTGSRQQTGFIAYFVRRSTNSFEQFLKYLGPRNERFFPCPPWKKVEVEIENGVGWNQLQCPYYEFFKKEGAVELTKAYCDIDRLVAGHVPDSVELRRERTLANGDSSCDFYYYRKQL